MGRALRDLCEPHGMVPVGHQWFEFSDNGGHGYCQTDYFIQAPRGILLVECKLTQTTSAFLQMSQLYVPVLEMVYGKPVTCLQVCKGLRYQPEAEAEPEGLLAEPRPGNFTWHYLGH